LTGEDSLLREAWRAGRGRWPDVGLAFEAFASHVAALRAEGDAPSDDDLACHGGDIFLAAACLANDVRALAALEREFLAPLPRIVTAIDRSPGFGTEVAQALRERLLCPPLLRLGQYSGAGSLAGWLRVVAKRLAVDLKRREGASLRQMDQLETALVRYPRDPEWELVHRRFRQPLEAALRGALDALEARDRMVLRLYLIRGANIAAIGRHGRALDRGCSAHHHRSGHGAPSERAGVLGARVPEPGPRPQERPLVHAGTSAVSQCSRAPRHHQAKAAQAAMASTLPATSSPLAVVA
jgi:RNA polymerase sigma-70 factor (ECF subfamily)